LGFGALGALAVSLGTSFALAEPAEGAGASPAPTSASATATVVSPAPSTAPAASPAEGAAAPAVRRDPKGVTGISPYTEALLRGDAAYLARDFASAEREYKAAVESSPQEAPGHLRLAAVAAEQARLEEALQFAEAAARFAGPDAKLRSDALRMSAMMIEAGGSIERAIAAWKLFAIEDARVPRKTPVEDIASGHVARLEARQKMIEQGTLVREKIKKELEGTPGNAASSPAAPTAAPVAAPGSK
jgi:tetratricopeptide (TPR) repeat protein